MREFLEKYGLRLLIITTVCAVLISVLSFVSATSGFLQNAVGVLTYPFRSAVTAVAAWAEDKQRYYKDYSDLIAENEALRERVAELERDARQAEADREENALLRELLELREQRRDLTFESAAVIDRESTNWTSALTLNRGTAHGVEKNDCVVSAEGDLVGVVSAVGYNWCTVLTVIDTDTELGARVFRTQEVAVAEGDLALMGEGKLKLSYLSAAAQRLHHQPAGLFQGFTCRPVVRKLLQHPRRLDKAAADRIHRTHKLFGLFKPVRIPKKDAPPTPYAFCFLNIETATPRI